MFEIFAEVVAAGHQRRDARRSAASRPCSGCGTPRSCSSAIPPCSRSARSPATSAPTSAPSRRNAYWRMFGIDLSHDIPPRWGGRAGTAGWKADVGAGVNTSFREKWSELLRQVWLGYENRKNSSGANATDDAYLLLLCDSLRDMLNMRRRGAALAREEFKAVAVMSWFDETLQFNTPIVQTLKATATSPADRLALVGRAGRNDAGAALA